MKKWSINIENPLNPKTNLIVNSIALILLSPFLGVLFTGIFGGLLLTLIEGVIWILGAITSIFFEVNFGSFGDRWGKIETFALWVIFLGGSVGGFIWGISEVRAKWKQYYIDGSGWTN